MPNLGTLTKCSPELSVISSEEDSDTLVGCFVLDSLFKTVLIHLTRTDVSTSSCMVRQQYQSSSHWQGWLESTIRNPDPGIVLTKAVGVLKDFQIIIADDCFELLKIPADRVVQVVIKSTEKLFGRQVLKHENLGEYFDSKVPSLKGFHKTNELKNVMRLIQRYEFKNNHNEWIESVKPALDPDISAEIGEMLEISETMIENWKSIRNEMRSAISSLLKDDGILVTPTTAYPPPKLGGKEMLSEDYQNRAFSLLSIASVSGCCQVTVPLGYYDKCPTSVSFIARHGGDRFLLDTVQNMYASLQEQADIATKSKLSTNTFNQKQSAEIAKEKGNQAYKDKQWLKAISFYTEAIKLNGNNATYYSNRAAAYLESGSFLQAEADCTKAINLDKKNVKAYLRRGTAREMLGYYKEAIEDFSYALVLEPTNKRASLSADRLRKVFM